MTVVIRALVPCYMLFFFLLFYYLLTPFPFTQSIRSQSQSKLKNIIFATSLSKLSLNWFYKSINSTCVLTHTIGACSSARWQIASFPLTIAWGPIGVSKLLYYNFRGGQPDATFYINVSFPVDFQTFIFIVMVQSLKNVRSIYVTSTLQSYVQFHESNQSIGSCYVCTRRIYFRSFYIEREN